MTMQRTDITGMPRVEPLRDRLAPVDTSPLWLLVMLSVIIAFATFMVAYH